MRQLTPAGRNFIRQQEEGFEHSLIGLGTSDADLDHYLSASIAAVEKHVKHPLSDNQFTALVSMVYHEGEHHLFTHPDTHRALRNALRSDDHSTVPEHMAVWNLEVGEDGHMQISDRVTARRQAEINLWSTP